MAWQAGQSGPEWVHAASAADRGTDAAALTSAVKKGCVAMRTTGFRNSRQTRGFRAFTLIEVMIVIAIILALSGLVGVALFRQRDSAKVDLARTDMLSLRDSLDFFRLDFDRYPSDE